MLRNAHGRDVLGSQQCVVADALGVDKAVRSFAGPSQFVHVKSFTLLNQVPKIIGSGSHGRGLEGEEGLVSPKVAFTGTLTAVARVLILLSFQVAVVALIIAAVAIAWWLVSRRRRFGAVDVADLFEAVEVDSHAQ